MGQFDEVSMSFITGATLEHINGGADGTTLDCDCATVGKDVGLLGEYGGVLLGALDGNCTGLLL